MSSNASTINTLAHNVKKGSTRKKLYTAPVRVAEVLAKRSLGLGKSKIARDLKMSRNTVDHILSQSKAEQNWAQELQAIVPDAISSVHKQIRAGDGQLGMRYIEQVVLTDRDAKSFVDNRIQLAVGTLIGTTEAAAKAPLVTKCEPVQTQFLPISNSNPNKTLDLAVESVQLSLPFPEEVP